MQNHKWNHTQYVAFCDWPQNITQHNVFKVHPCYSINQYFISSYCQIIFHCIDIPHCVYPFISLWTFRFFSLFGYHEKCCCGHWLQVFMWTYVFINLGYIPTSGSAGSYQNSTVNILRNFPTVFKAAAPFYILTSNVQCSSFPTSSPTLVIIFFIIAILVGVKWYQNFLTG